jgi:hypothetical protein
MRAGLPAHAAPRNRRAAATRVAAVVFAVVFPSPLVVVVVVVSVAVASPVVPVVSVVVMWRLLMSVVLR